MAKLESLVVDLQLETAELRKGLDEIKGQFEELNETAKGLLNFEVFKEIGKHAFEAAEKLTHFVLESAEAADKMGKLAQKIGVPVDELSRLSFAANASGVSTDELSGALGKLNVNLASAAAGSKEQAIVFRALGISVKDASGATRATADVLRDVAEKFSDMSDGASKGKLAVDLFGKSGKDLIPFLNEGKDGIKELTDEADRLGVTLDEKGVRAATQFNDNLAAMKAAVQGVGTRVAEQLAPAMANLADEFLHSQSGAEALKDAATVLATVLKSLVTAGIAVGAAFEYVATALAGGLASAIAAFSGDFRGANEIVASMQKELAATVENAGRRIDGVWADNAKSFDEGAKHHKNAADSYVADIERMKTADADRQKALEFQRKLDELLMKDHVRDVEAAAKGSAVEDKAATLSQQFRDIGGDQALALKRATDGFKNYDDALEAYVASQKSIFQDQADLDKAKAGIDQDAYDEASDRLQSELRTSAELERVMDAFKGIKVEGLAETKRAIAAIGSITMSFVSKLGELGQVVQSAVSGFQQGGVWGALIAVIVEVVTRFEGFSAVVDTANKVLFNFIGSMGPALGALTKGLSGLLDGLGSFLNVIGSTLQAPLRAIGDALGMVGKLLSGIFGSGIGDSLSALSEIVDVMTEFVQILNPLGPIIKLVSASFGLIGVASNELVSVLMMAGGWLLEQVRQVLAALGLNDMALEVGKLALKLNAGALSLQQKADQQWEKLGHTFDDLFKVDHAPDAAAEGGFRFEVVKAGDGFEHFTEQMTDATKAVTHFAEELTNTPQGFKYKLRSYQVQNATDVDAGGRLGGGDIHVHAPGGVFTTVSQLVDLVHQGISKKNSRRTGAPNWASGT